MKRTEEGEKGKEQKKTPQSNLLLSLLGSAKVQEDSPFWVKLWVYFKYNKTKTEEHQKAKNREWVSLYSASNQMINVQVYPTWLSALSPK